MTTTVHRRYPRHPHEDGCLGVDILTRWWHGAYCRWYDNRRQGHRVRAGIWGEIADRIIRTQDVLRRLKVTR